MPTDIIEDNTALIYKIASKFYGVEKEDLYQAGILGLLKAYQNYIPDSTCKFSSYAYNYIYGEMYMLSYNKSLKYNKDILRLYQNVEKARYALAQKYGKVPDNNEIAAFLEMPVANIEEAIIAGNSVMMVDMESDEQNCIENMANDENGLNTLEKLALEESMNMLSDEERKIIMARYYEDLTQCEVARKLKMTQVKVSRYEKKGLDKMHSFLAS